GSSIIGNDLPWDDIDETTGNVTWDRWDTTEENWNKIGIGEDVFKTLAGDDLGFIYELNRDNDDYTTTISAITKASSAVLTVAESAFKVGDIVSVSSVEGMTEINNFDPDTNEFTRDLYIISAATATSVTLNVDSSNFTTYTGGGILSKPIQFKARTNPLNPYRAMGKRFYVSEVEFLIETSGGGLQVDVVANESVDPTKEDTIIKSTTIRQSDEWVTMSVNEEADFITFIFKQTSPAVQVKIKSVRIHGEAGGFTSG
ncbi:MAG: hypothetical protein KAI88_06335, partial [Nitrosomonadaceae bacterium]|nr:hypothetical protein [Nitrosomonadaceae bacterium]